MQASLIGTVEQAAKDLLSKLDGSKRVTCSPSSYDPSDAEGSEAEDLSTLDPTMPLFFICEGFAGLVVKRVSMLDIVYAWPSFS